MTDAADLDRAVVELSEHALAFARMLPREKAALLRSILQRLAAAAPEIVALSCRAKGIDPASAQAGEEWLAGPAPLIANARLLAESLEDIAAEGRPFLPREHVKTRRDDRVEALLVPRGAERSLYGDLETRVLFVDGVRRDDVNEEQARFYAQSAPEGGVKLVLGAGNVSSVGPMDALHALFVRGEVVLLKPSPVNAYLGPALERALAPLVEHGFLRFAYGGADTGAYLAEHAGVGSVHLTGSLETHDRLVWGAPGAERDRRKAESDPALKKPVTSELGNVGPVLVVPCLYAKDDLFALARDVVSQVVNNASFNCNAARMVVLPACWAQRGLFVELLCRAFAEVPPRRAYYPGAAERHAQLTGGRERAIRFGEHAGEGTLPWTIVPWLDPTDAGEPLFTTEPFSPVLGIVAVGCDDPLEFLAVATDFCNERLWGTLSAAIFAHPVHADDPAIARALDQATLRLRYGAIAVNKWPAVAFGMASAPWGGHPSATLADAKSGLGFVHDTRMLERVEKVVVRAPQRGRKAAYRYDNRRMREIGERVTAFAAAPGWAKLPGLGWSAARG